MDPTVSAEQQSVAKPSRRYRMWTAVMLLSFSVAALALFVAAADWGSRNYALNSLLAAVEQSEAEMVATNEGVARISGEFSPAEAADPQQRQQVRADLEQFAAASRSRLAAAGADLPRVWVLPWQEDVIAARDAYMAHHAAWLRYLAEAGDDAAVLFGEYPDIPRTWDTAEKRIRAAVPVPAWPGTDERLDDLFNDPTAPEDAVGA